MNCELVTLTYSYDLDINLPGEVLFSVALIAASVNPSIVIFHGILFEHAL